MDFKKELSAFLSKTTDVPLEQIYQLLEIPPEDMGDFALPCFFLAKKFKKAPQSIAADLAATMEKPPFISKITPVGGYLNFCVDEAIFAKHLLTQIAQQNFGQTQEGAGKLIAIDFSSPNVAKRFHIGHLYSTLIGNSLSKIYRFLGYDVYRINFLGDWGTQFGKLITAIKHFGNEAEVEKFGIEELERLYVLFHEKQTPALEDEARQWLLKMQQGEEDALKIWRWVVDVSLDEYSKEYQRLGVTFDSFKGESFYNDKLDAVVDELRQKSLLTDSEGAKIVDLEKFNMPPCLILRGDGGSLYPTRDIASALYRKKEYNFYKCLYVTDSRQSLHFAQWFKVIGLMGYDWEKDLVHVPYGLLSLEDGALSSRLGKRVLIQDYLDEAVRRVAKVSQEKNPNISEDEKQSIANTVGLGAVIFSTLYNSRIKDNVFSLDKALSLDGETGPYVQYTHVRAANVLEKAGNFDAALADYNAFADKTTFAVVKTLYDFPAKVSLAAERNEPFVISRYLIALSQSFNKFYHDINVLNSPNGTREARLLLVQSVKTVISSALALLGIDAPNKM